MFNKKANSIIFSLVSLISLSIGGLFGFAYVQFWSNSAKKRTDFDNKEWELLAESALSTELDYLQNETLHSQFITNISNKLSPLPKITISNRYIFFALDWFFDDSHFEEQMFLI
ncbi:hypothetical protein JTY60_02145 [symbiont of Argiope bruennichi]|uniref:hypothetical protein n=1 Tax=symbiont of Argiope bruennichi TaxID=2810479 RepID=UPI003DA6A2EE